MAVDLFAGVPVTDYAAALPWYERFFGGRPSFLPNDTEAVWEVAEHRLRHDERRHQSRALKTGRVTGRNIFLPCAIMAAWP